MRYFSFLVLAVFMVLAPSVARAELKIDVTRGTSDPIPVAITNFVPNDASGQEFATSIPQVIANDLSDGERRLPICPR